MALDNDWYEPVLETWLMDLKLYGFEIKDNEIYCRLSYSQGDGASFDIKEVNVKRFLERIDKVSDFETFLYYEKLGSFTPTFYTIKNSFSTHYCHEKTRNLEYELICHDDFEVEPDYEKVVLEANAISKLIEEKRLEICKDIYNDLREYREELEEIEKEEDVILEQKTCLNCQDKEHCKIKDFVEDFLDTSTFSCSEGEWNE